MKSRASNKATRDPNFDILSIASLHPIHLYGFEWRFLGS